MDKKYTISFLIPCTSNGRPQWKTINDTYFVNYSLKSSLLTLDNEHKYIYYLGYDNDDRIFSVKKQQDIIKKYENAFRNIEFKFIKLKNIAKGHVTKMWNVLFQNAYDDDCDYFYQCGDDIVFKTKGWVNDCINKLCETNDIGLTGPINNNNRILTQAFVSRKHMDIFGWFFPEEIINWCCDDWYNLVYKPNFFFPLDIHYCSNDGGEPRYKINNNVKFRDKFLINLIHLRELTTILANKHREKIEKYIEDNSDI